MHKIICLELFVYLYKVLSVIVDSSDTKDAGRIQRKIK